MADLYDARMYQSHNSEIIFEYNITYKLYDKIYIFNNLFKPHIDNDCDMTEGQGWSVVINA